MKDNFPSQGTHLERYAAELSGVEINSSFYRPHQQKTYARWAASTPDDFRFAVKIPKIVTHTKRLIGVEEDLARFNEEICGLGAKLGPLLVQLPPSLAFDSSAAESFLRALRVRHVTPIVWEARHASWFHAGAEQCLRSYGVAQVLADPAPCPDLKPEPAAQPLIYLRLHGSPQIYRSNYSTNNLKIYADMLREEVAKGKMAWCIFDNTAEGGALPNALEMRDLLANSAHLTAAHPDLR